MKPTPFPRPGRYAAWLLVTGAMVPIAGYLATREATLYQAGTTSSLRLIVWNLILLGVITGNNVARGWCSPPPEATRWTWRRASVWDALAFFGTFQALPLTMIATIPADDGRGMDFIFVVSDWLQIAQEVRSFVVSAPVGALGMTAVFCALVYGLSLGWRLRTVAGIVAVWGLIATRMAAEGTEDALFAFIFYPAAVVAGVAVLWRRPILATRALGWACMSTFIGLVYLGDLPVGDQQGWRDTKGVERLYPCDETPPHYPMRFPRAVEVDVAGGQLFLAYGPSSGVVVFDLETGCFKGHFGAIGMARNLYKSPRTGRLYVANDITAHVYAVNPENLSIEQQIDLYLHDGVNDALTMTVLEDQDRLYITHYIHAAITEVVLSDLSFVRSIDLAAMGHTPIPASVVSMTPGARPGEGYALIGPVDTDRNWRVLALDLNTLTVTRSALVPGGTNYIWYSAARDSLWMAGGAVPSLLEVDAKTLEVRREVLAPAFSMAFEPVPQRGVLLAAGPVDPNLGVICEETGELVRRIELGPKIMGIRYSPELDAAFVASGQGVFRVDGALLSCDTTAETRR